MEEECKEWALLDMVIYFLYDAENYYDAEMSFLTFYDGLICLDHSQQLCERLTYYIKQTTIPGGKTGINHD